ncbi:MAG TPA: MBL fold metallo-hydrolase [Clostridia bacterium]
MKLTIYGNNASCPAKDGACSCCLLEADQKNILIDMGNGCLAKLQHHYDLSAINVIIISHLHFDHFADLFCAKYQLETRKSHGERIDRILLLTPALPDWAYNKLSTNNIFEMKTISDNMNLKIPDSSVDVSFIKVSHLVESYGMRFSCNNKIFAYSGDSGLCPELNRIASFAALFLCESSFLAQKEFDETHHLSAKSAANISLEANAEKLVLTHYNPILKEALLDEAKKYFSNVSIAEIFDSFEI